MMVANGLAKLLEEIGELGQVAAKKLAYYHTDEHPDGGKPLSERLEEEIADVIAASRFVSETFELNTTRIEARIAEKLNRFKEWHSDPDN